MTPTASRMILSVCEEYDNSPNCDNHEPVQHRDGKPPWCRTCKRF